MDFQNEVIDLSQELPVLVDFWAPWCGPCKVLGPIIETVCIENADKVKLVKINTEEEPELAQQFQIYSIPHVKLFHKGEVINEFSGALSKPQLEKWLEEHLPTVKNDELSYLLSTQADYPDERLANKLRLWMEDNHESVEGRVQLSKHIVFNNPDEVDELLIGIQQDNKWYDTASNIMYMASFLIQCFDEKHPVGNKLSEAQKSLKRHDLSQAIQLIIDAVSIDKSYQDQTPRLVGIAMFNILGFKHPLTIEYRKLFDMMIW